MDANQSAPQKTNASYKILVVDDEPDAKEIFVELLSTVEGYEVFGAADGIDALAKIEAEKPDLVLLDIVMPRKDGIETLTDIMENPDKYGKPKIVMLTNIGGDVAVEKALEVGAVGYKLKIDTDPEELIRYVGEVLKGE